MTTPGGGDGGKDTGADLVDTLRAVLRPHLERSAPLRALAAAVGEFLLAEAAKPAPAKPPVQPEAPAPPAAPAAPAPQTEPARAAPTPPPRPAPSPEPPPPTGPRAVVPLRLGGAEAPVVVRGSSGEVLGAMQSYESGRAEPDRWQEPVTLDLQLIAFRCGLKARACRTFIERRAAAPDSAEEARLISEIQREIDTARDTTGCYLWMVNRQQVQPPDATLEIIARWYDALGAAASLMTDVDDSPTAGRAEVAETMQLLAWATAGLREVLTETWLTKPDLDQDDSHAWLRWETKSRTVLVLRHMRLDNPPAPESIGELEAGLRGLRQRVEEKTRRSTEVHKLCNKVRYHADMLSTERSTEPHHDWARIEAALGELERHSLTPDDDRVAALFEELVDGELQPPQDAPRSHAAITVARSLVAAANETPAEGPERRWSERVARVRRLLEGRRMVIVGGERRGDAIDRLCAAFGLADIDWVELAEHASGLPMRAPIQHDDTALVVVLIKLAGHLHVDEARRYAKAARKPVVMLKAGYNPERLALAVLNQASDQLAAPLSPA
ncbi:MAG: hypothetical protein IT431_08250 [Phycisphaerales bacterium]|nr:hypothetical protein [Phycisphaerales bacterium]